MASSENVFIAPAVNNKAIHREIVTPHKIAVLLLIKKQYMLKEECEFCREMFKGVVDDKAFDSVTDFNPVLHIKYMKRFFFVILKLIQTPDLDFAAFKAVLTEKCGGLELAPELISGFHEMVDMLLREGVISLMDTMSDTTRLISAGKGGTGIAKHSVLGLFLRRILLSFDKMPFTQIVDLYKEFGSYASPLPKRGDEEEHLNRWTRKEVEQFFTREVGRLLTEPPGPLQEKINNLLQCNPDFAEAHFLSFLNCVRCKELCGAKESLHQCFDRAVLPMDRSPVNAEERCFRYGTLNLAAMHCLFGNWDEANLALKEVIRLSHNAGDSICLQHCLSWLFLTTTKNKELLINRAMARCSDLDLGYLMSLAIQSYTKFSCQTGGRPSAVFDVLMKSDVLNCQQYLTELPANSYGLKAGLWSLFGNSNISSMYSQLLLRFRGNLHPPFCQALCNFAHYLADQGEYHHAMTLLNETQEFFPRQETQSWMVSYQEIHFAHLMNQARFNEASECISLLAPIKPTESIIRKVWQHHLSGDNYRALACADIVLKRSQMQWETDPEMPPVMVRTLLAKAQLLQPGEALELLLKALDIAQDYFLCNLSATVMIHISNNLLKLSMGRRALRLIDTVMSNIMGQGTCLARGQVLMHLSYSRLNLSKEFVSDYDLDTVDILSYAQEWLLKAHDYVRVKHVWYLKAIIFHSLGMTSERNKASHEFRQLEEIYPSPISFFASF